MVPHPCVYIYNISIHSCFTYMRLSLVSVRMGSSVLVMHYEHTTTFLKKPILSMKIKRSYILFYLKCQQQYPGLPYDSIYSVVSSQMIHSLPELSVHQPLFSSVCLLGCNILNGPHGSHTRLCMYIGVRISCLWMCVCEANIWPTCFASPLNLNNTKLKSTFLGRNVLTHKSVLVMDL